METHFSLGLAAILFAATFSACSSDEDATETELNPDRKAITFSTVSDMAKQTRATAVTPSNAETQVSNFKVWAYFNQGSDQTYYMGTAGQDGLILDRDQSNTANWNHRTATDKHYWPSTSTPLNFYALTPAENDNYSFNSEALTYNVPTDNAQQQDVMVARANDQTSETSNGNVALQFQHALSQISFSAKTNSTDLTVEVNGITVHNVNNSYTFNLKDGSAATSLGNETANYAIGMAASPVTVSSTTDATNLTADNGVLLMAPQTLTAWANNTATTAADAATPKQSYLEISCKIMSHGLYLVGSADEYGTAYVSFPTTWEAGKKYVYTLVFGGGKKADGTDQLTPITFSVTATDWNTDAENNSDVTL